MFSPFRRSGARSLVAGGSCASEHAASAVSPRSLMVAVAADTAGASAAATWAAGLAWATWAAGMAWGTWAAGLAWAVTAATAIAATEDMGTVAFTPVSTDSVWATAATVWVTAATVWVTAATVWAATAVTAATVWVMAATVWVTAATATLGMATAGILPIQPIVTVLQCQRSAALLTILLTWHRPGDVGDTQAGSALPGNRRRAVVNVRRFEGHENHERLPGNGRGQSWSQVGDVLRSVNGYLTEQRGNLAWIIANATPNNELKLNVQTAKDGQTHEIAATIP